MTGDIANTCVLAACLALTACSGHSGAAGSAGSTGGKGSTGSTGSSGSGLIVFGTDVLTYHNDAMRTGQDLTESLLTPQNVNATSFGKLRLLPADGLVDAAPLIVSGISLGGVKRNVVYIASEHDSVYAYDADSGELLLQTSLLGSGESSSDARGCSQVAPEIGITATPVIDRSAGPNGTLFVVAMTRDASGNYHQRLHALDLQTLADRLPATTIQASATSLTIADYFTPANTAAESANDVDLGAGSVVLLMDQTDSAGTMHHLMTVGGKDANLYVLDRDHLGRFNSSSNAAYQQIPLGGGLFCAPVYFNGRVYVGDVGGTLQAFSFANAQLSATASSQSAQTFAYPGTSPALSAQGSANAILWALESAPGSAAVLHAYNPANLGEEYYNSTQAGAGRDSFGNGNKFITPVIANGKVFIGTPNGVAVFGLL